VANSTRTITSPPAHGEHSPVRTQYLSIKREYPDAIIFYRMGDFYETFDTDAEVVARELEITLTKRDWGRGERSPMAGVPHHAGESYVARLIAKGYRVAVVEQMTEPTGKGIVERDVTRIVTPGTVVEPSMLAARRNNYLAAVALARESAGVAYVDITTGEFACTQILSADPVTAIAQEMARIAPIEVLVEVPQHARKDPRAIRVDANEDLVDEENGLPSWAASIAPFAGHLTPLDGRDFAERAARDRLQAHFQVASLEAFGCEQSPMAVRAAGAILSYLNLTQRGALDQLTSLETYSVERYMLLDAYTRRNLELFESGRERNTKGSLYWVLDQTRTPMGSRLLRRWMGQPLLDIPALIARQDAIAALIARPLDRARLTQSLSQVGDLERLANRILQRIATPRDLVALASGLRAVEQLLDGSAGDLLSGAVAGVTGPIDPCADVAAIIESIIVDEPPISLTDGGIIRPGSTSELDEIIEKSRDAREWIAALEGKERARTGISNLKVGFNKVFGYFIEISNSNVNRAPSDYIRKQTITNGERFITPALKEYETLVLNAQERSTKLEYEIFVQLRTDMATIHAERLVETARAIAALDVLLAFAEDAERYNYVRPTLNDGSSIHIVAGRHPVIERAQNDSPFVPNDINLANDGTQIMLITGPNMSGKSTIMRQTALIVLMAQIGCYVPAEAAAIGVVDRIFTRIGAQDDIATGQSTFMVEMIETANILRHATSRSLVILDEIGRGTSTYDGLAIARAILEYLHQHQRCGAKTLFATHYHELVEAARALPHIKPYTIAVTEENGHVIFLRTLVPGGADRSYGLHVAQLAGIPKQVIRRAEDVLGELERLGDANHRRRTMRDTTPVSALQLSLFTPPAEPDPVIEQVRDLPLDETTPLEALQLLYRLQAEIKGRE
jgi:DNA mismatch repair protein MutS